MTSTTALESFRRVIDDVLAPVRADLIAIKRRLDRCFPPPAPYARVAATPPPIAKRSVATRTTTQASATPPRPAPSSVLSPIPTTPPPVSTSVVTPTTPSPVSTTVVTPTPPPVVSPTTPSTESPPTAIKDACRRIESVLDELRDLQTDPTDDAFHHVLHIIGFDPNDGDIDFDPGFDNTATTIAKLRSAHITTFHALMRAPTETISNIMHGFDLKVWQSVVYWRRLYHITPAEFLAIDVATFEDEFMDSPFLGSLNNVQPTPPCLLALRSKQVTFDTKPPRVRYVSPGRPKRLRRTATNTPSRNIVDESLRPSNDDTFSHHDDDDDALSETNSDDATNSSQSATEASDYSNIADDAYSFSDHEPEDFDEMCPTIFRVFAPIPDNETAKQEPTDTVDPDDNGYVPPRDDDNAPDDTTTSTDDTDVDPNRHYDRGFDAGMTYAHGFHDGYDAGHEMCYDDDQQSDACSSNVTPSSSDPDDTSIGTVNSDRS